MALAVNGENNHQNLRGALELNGGGTKDLTLENGLFVDATPTSCNIQGNSRRCAPGFTMAIYRNYNRYEYDCLCPRGQKRTCAKNIGLLQVKGSGTTATLKYDQYCSPGYRPERFLDFDTKLQIYTRSEDYKCVCGRAP